MCEVTILMFVTVRPIKVRAPVLIQSITATMETNVQQELLTFIQNDYLCYIF